MALNTCFGGRVPNSKLTAVTCPRRFAETPRFKEPVTADKIPRYGSTKRIISLHNFRETPDDLKGIQTRLAKLDSDIVKIATMAHNPYDNLRMLRLLRDSKIPTVGMCMGEIGTPDQLIGADAIAPPDADRIMEEPP